MANLEPASTLLHNARIVLPDRTIDSAELAVENGRVANISSAAARSSASAVDLTGLTLYPGFIDVHIHGAVGVDTMAANAKDLLRAGEFLARKGVTAWLATLVPAAHAEYEKSVRAISEAMASAGDELSSTARV